MQGVAQDLRQKHLKQVSLSVGDLILMNTKNYYLQLLSYKSRPKWMGPLQVLQVQHQENGSSHVLSCVTVLL